MLKGLGASYCQDITDLYVTSCYQVTEVRSLECHSMTSLVGKDGIQFQECEGGKKYPKIVLNSIEHFLT